MSSEVETSLNVSGNSKRFLDFARNDKKCEAKVNSYTHPLNPDQVKGLRALLDELGFEFSSKEYTIFFAQKNKLSVAVYEKGPKVLVQGKGVEEFVQFELEPKILGEAKLGYEEVHAPEMLEPHFGVAPLKHETDRRYLMGYPRQHVTITDLGGLS